MKQHFFYFINNYNRLFKKTPLNLSSGFEILDNELPNNNWPKSCLIELLSNNTTEADIDFIVPTLKQIINKNQMIVIFSKSIFIHYDKLLSAGIPENLLVIIDSQSSIEKISKLNTDKRMPIGAVIGWIGNEQSFTSLQRIQACLKTSNAHSFLFRSLSTKDKPSPSPFRITMEKIGLSKVRMMIIKRRGPTTPKTFNLELCKIKLGTNVDYVISNKDHKLLNKFFYDSKHALSH